jgi:hypothetical protein
MDTVMLLSVFLSALVISGGVVLIFSALIDGVLRRLITGEMAAAWTLFTKFALFVAALTGGLRLADMGALLSSAQTGAAQSSINSAKVLLEVFKAVLGTLNGAVWMLLLIFGAALTWSLAQTLYASVRPARVIGGAPEPDADLAASSRARSRQPDDNG